MAKRLAETQVKTLEWLDKQKQHITLWQTPFVLALSKKSNGVLDDDTIRKYGKLWQALIGAQWQLNNRYRSAIPKEQYPLDHVWDWRLGRALQSLGTGMSPDNSRLVPQFTREEMTQPAQPFIYGWIEKLLRMAFEFEDDKPAMRVDDFELQATLNPDPSGESSFSISVSKEVARLVVPALRVTNNDLKRRGYYLATMTYAQALKWIEYDPDRRYEFPAAALTYTASEGVLYMPIQVGATGLIVDDKDFQGRALMLTSTSKYEVLMGNAVMMAIATAVKEKPACKDDIVMVQFFESDGLKSVEDIYNRQGIRRAVQDFQELNNVSES